MDDEAPGSIDNAVLTFRRRTALAGGGLTAGLIALGVSRLRGSQQTIIRPEDIARAADGDDAAPMIQAAIDRVAAAGGGTVRLTGGKTYPLRAIARGTDISQPFYRASLAIPPRAANVTIDLNGATLEQQSDAFTFGAAYRMFNDEAMQKMRQPLGYTPSRGDTSIRVRNPAAFPPGSRVMLVSGNIYPREAPPGRAKPYTPVAEMFTVTGARSGEIMLDRAVQKDHSIARGKDTGLIDISQHHAQNIRLIGPGTVINRYRRAGAFRQIFGFTMDKVAYQGSGGFSIRGRDLAVTDCSARIIRGQNEGVQPYALAFDTGSNDIRVERFTAIGEPFCYIHLHEGLSNVLLSDIEIENAWQPDPNWVKVAAISIMGLSWNVDLENITVVNNPQGVGIGARESAGMNGGNFGLTMHDITLRGRFKNPALQIDDRIPAHVSGLDISGVELSRGQQPIRLIGARHQIIGLHA
jgi:hypothetical protein